MYKRIIVCSGLLLLLFSASACDICGCSSGGGFTGILPQFQRHFIGMRYTYRSYQTTHPTTDGSKLTSMDRFHTGDLWGRFYLHKRVQLFAVVPLNSFSQTESGSTVRTTGLGDVQIFVNYSIIQTPDSSKSVWRHLLMAGGGIKAPTGENNAQSRIGERLNQNLQPGTGAWDAIVNAIYTVRYKQWGMNWDANARITTTNNQGFKFGHRVGTSLKFFYWAKYRNWSFLPQVGILADYGMKDKDKGVVIHESGGLNTLATIGTDIYFKRYVAGFTFQQPLQHSLAAGSIQPFQKYSVNVAFLF